MKHCSDCQYIIFDFSKKQYLDIAMKLRMKVFVKEQSVPKKLEYDGDDALATHILMYYNEKPVATCRYRTTDNGIKLERFAVKKNKRDSGLGKTLLKIALDETQSFRKTRYLYAQTAQIGFYEKMGFYAIGETFPDAGIEHIKMIYREKHG
ncbi:MAG: GNAT family N-acetyltransferase [Bacteroidales bacterium]|nr:GNAT family N-acetyltransferase [Bacteroidales bacterium]